MEIKHLLQIIFILIVMCEIVIIIIKVVKKNDKKTYMPEGMMLGFVTGANFGYYIVKALVCTPIGMFLGVEIGKNIKKK